MAAPKKRLYQIARELDGLRRKIAKLDAKRDPLIEARAKLLAEMHKESGEEITLFSRVFSYEHPDGGVVVGEEIKEVEAHG